MNDLLKTTITKNNKKETETSVNPEEGLDNCDHGKSFKNGLYRGLVFT